MLQDLHHHLQDSKLLPPRSKLLLAVSGGIDSVTLLDLLSQLNQYYNWDIAVAHLDHKTRSDSAQDAALVGRLADQHGYKFFLGQLDGAQKKEAALRSARYDFLEELASAGGYDSIVTAHHGDDRIETSLLNSIRGADRNGLTALQAKRGKVVRPLLPFRKSDIIVYANLRNLAYREDSTNSNPEYRRNFVRNELLPLGALNYKDFRTKYNASLDRLEMLNDRIDGGLQQILDEVATEQNHQKIELDNNKLAKLPEIVQLNLLSFAAKKLNPGVSLSQKNLNQALTFTKKAHVGSATHLTSGLHLLSSYGTVIITSVPITSGNSQNTRTQALRVNSPLQHGLFKLRLFENPMQAPAVQAMVQPMNLYVRTWQPGDRVQPVGMLGSKKLQDVFSDAKVPRHLRSHWPVVVNARGEIVWLPTLATNRRFAAENSKQAYQLICEVL